MKEKSDSLPHGYVNLGPVSLHEVDLARYVENLDRFLANLEDAKALLNSAGAASLRIAIWRRNVDEVGLLLTIAELADLMERFVRTADLMNSAPGPAQ